MEIKGTSSVKMRGLTFIDYAYGLVSRDSSTLRASDSEIQNTTQTGIICEGALCTTWYVGIHRISGVGILCGVTTTCEISSISLDSTNKERIPQNGIICAGQCKISGGSISSSHIGVRCYNNKGCEVKGTIIKNNDIGVECGTVSCTVTKNLIKENQDGVVCLKGCNVINNTIVYNTGRGIFVENNSPFSTIINNISAYNKQGYVVATQDSPVNLKSIELRYNLAWQNTNGNISVPIMPEGNIYYTVLSDPKFKNLQLGDYSLVDGSPAFYTVNGRTYQMGMWGDEYPTETPTPIPTLDITPTVTYTLIPTNTLVPTSTVTPILTNTVRPTSTNTPIPTNTLRPTSTSTPVPTNTVRPIATNTPRPTATNNPIPTNTTKPLTVTNSPTNTPLSTATPTSGVNLTNIVDLTIFVPGDGTTDNVNATPKVSPTTTCSVCSKSSTKTDSTGIILMAIGETMY
jgi:hypothetical protein